MITITDETIQAIAGGLTEAGEFGEGDSPDESAPSEEHKWQAVENWLLRMIREIEDNPGFYASGPQQYYNSRVSKFEVEPRCIDTGWGQRCSNLPQPGSVAE